MGLETVIAVISVIIALVSVIISAVALRRSEKHQSEMKTQAKKQATIEAFEKIQAEVLDKLINLSEKSANEAIEKFNNNENSEKCKRQYRDYELLIARLEHFAVGVYENVYDKDIVDKLAGNHLILMHSKIEPIIENVNKFVEKNSKTKGKCYYHYYTSLIEDLKKNNSCVGNSVYLVKK